MFKKTILASPLKTGWLVRATFEIATHSRDRALLERIQEYLGVGVIYERKKDISDYKVSSLKEITEFIIPHFDKYPLVGQKRADFELFKQIILLMNKKEHLTSDGLQQIINIRASLNNGLSDVLKSAFADFTAVPRPLVIDQKIPDPHWLAGFTDGEGCFRVDVQRDSKSKQVKAVFKIVQHSRDTELLKVLCEYLGCGKYSSEGSTVNAGAFTVRKLVDHEGKILQFFDKYPLHGVKRLDYADFKRVVMLMKNKAHLTGEGFEQVWDIKSKMNRNRKYESTQ